MQTWRDVDVGGLRLRRFWHVGLASCKGRQRCVCAVEGKGARIVDWDVDFDRIIEAGLQSGAKSASCTAHCVRTYHSLVFFELLSIELLMLAWNIHPQTSLATYRARAIDLESYTVGWDGGWAEVDVGRIAGQIG